MASFVEKLRLNNLYPTMPLNTGREIDPFEQFMTTAAQPLFNERSRLSGIANMAASPQTQQVPSYQPRDFTRQPMDVVYKPPASDQIAERILGVQREPVSEYQQEQLKNQRAEIGLRNKQLEATTGINQQKVDISRNRADVYKFKAENPNVKIVAQRGGSILAINPMDGSVIANLGPTGNMDEADRLALEQDQALARIGETGNQARLTEDTRQAGRESLAATQGQTSRDVAEINAGSRPTGNTRIETVKDASGKIIGARTVKTENEYQPTSGRPSSLAVGTRGTINGVPAIWDGKGWKRAQ